MTLIDRLDAAANKTGIPAFATRQPRRRRFRWLPLIALLLGFGVAGYGVANPDRLGIAISLMVVIQSIASCFIAAGPLYGGQGDERIDEFDRQLRLRAFLVGVSCVAGLAFAGIGVVIFAGILRHWTSIQMVCALTMLALLMITVFATVPTLHASWAMESLDEED